MQGQGFRYSIKNESEIDKTRLLNKDRKKAPYTIFLLLPVRGGTLAWSSAAVALLGTICAISAFFYVLVVFKCLA